MHRRHRRYRHPLTGQHGADHHRGVAAQADPALGRSRPSRAAARPPIDRGRGDRDPGRALTPGTVATSHRDCGPRNHSAAHRPAPASSRPTVAYPIHTFPVRPRHFRSRSRGPWCVLGVRWITCARPGSHARPALAFRHAACAKGRFIVLTPDPRGDDESLREEWGWPDEPVRDRRGAAVGRPARDRGRVPVGRRRRAAHLHSTSNTRPPSSATSCSLYRARLLPGQHADAQRRPGQRRPADLEDPPVGGRRTTPPSCGPAPTWSGPTSTGCSATPPSAWSTRCSPSSCSTSTATTHMQIWHRAKLADALGLTGSMDAARLRYAQTEELCRQLDQPRLLMGMLNNYAYTEFQSATTSAPRRSRQAAGARRRARLRAGPGGARHDRRDRDRERPFAEAEQTLRNASAGTTTAARGRRRARRVPADAGPRAARPRRHRPRAASLDASRHSASSASWAMSWSASTRSRPSCTPPAASSPRRSPRTRCSSPRTTSCTRRSGRRRPAPGRRCSRPPRPGRRPSGSASRPAATR